MQVCCLERLLLGIEGVSGARGRRMRGGCPAQDLGWLGMWATQEEMWLSSVARKKTDLAHFLRKIRGDAEVGVSGRMALAHGVSLLGRCSIPRCLGACPLLGHVEMVGRLQS